MLVLGHSTMASRWGILATMPRKHGVSGRTTMRFIFFNPRDRTMTLCFSGQQMGLPTSFILIVAPAISKSSFFALVRFVPSRLGLNFLRSQAPHLRYLSLVAQLFERVDRGFDHVVRIMGADRLSQHILNSNCLNHGT